MPPPEAEPMRDRPATVCTCPPVLLQKGPSPTCPTHGCTCGTWLHPKLVNLHCWVHTPAPRG